MITPPRSRLAVASLACSALACCPLTSFAGMMLGILALRRIRLAAGTLGGRRLALAGTLIGSASLVIQAGLIDAYRKNLTVQIETAISGSAQAFVEAAATGDLDTARAHWSDAPGAHVVTDDEIRSFGTTIDERYGQLTGVRVVSQALSAGGFESNAALILTFENGPRTGSGRFLFSHEMLDYYVAARVVELTVDDLEQQEVRLPVSE